EDGIRDGHVTGVQTCALPIFWESSKTLAQSKGRNAQKKSMARGGKHDESAFQNVTKAIQRWRIPPMISLPQSGVTISLWIILLEIGRASCRERVYSYDVDL